MSKITEKIAALKAKTVENGASEQEALAAFEKAQELMDKYGITEADVLKVSIKDDLGKDKWNNHTKAMHPAVKFCCAAIRDFCEVAAWVDQSDNYSANYYGFKQDVEMATYLTDMIANTLDAEWKAYRKANPRSHVSYHNAYWSFMTGAGRRISERLREIIDARKPQKASDGTSLVVAKMEVVKRGQAELNLNLRNSRTRGNFADPTSYREGQEAGNRANLQRPINEKQAADGRLLG